MSQIFKFQPRILWILALVSFLFSCTAPVLRQPQAASDLLEDLQQMKSQIEANSLDENSCHAYFQNKLNLLKEERVQEFPIDEAVAMSEKLVLSTWGLRLAIHQRLATLSSCRTELRQIFYRLRAIEDLAVLKSDPVKQVSIADLGDMQLQPIPLVDNAFYHGYLGSNANVETAAVNFQSGDLLITRGGSFFSAVLSSITDYPAQLDHFVLVHKDEAGVLNTIESYAQLNGVSRFQMEHALKNENPRMLLLRPKDQALGARAAQIMYDATLLGEKNHAKQIGYDFTMDLTNDKKMTCSAVTYWGYLKASNGQFVIPEERSTLSPKLSQIFKQTGIKSTPMLTAEDMELDSRFDLILEFRDHRLLEDSRLREAVEQSVFRWIKEDNYLLQPTLKTLAIDEIIFPLRRTPLWPLIAQFAGNSIPDDAPKGFVKTLMQLNDISDVLFKVAYDANKKFFQTTGWSMTHDQIMAALDDYRKSDLQKCQAGVTGQGPQLHLLFSPVSCH